MTKNLINALSFPFFLLPYKSKPQPISDFQSIALLTTHSLFLTALMFLHGKDRMEFQNPPSKFARPTNHDTENCGRWTMTKKDRSESDEGEDNAGLSLGLELGLGLNSSGSKSRGFTFLQIQELHHQSLIYKYIEAGLPVPLHLLVPIWKSFAAASINCGHHFPSFLGANPLMYLEYGKSLDPEPGRCRRTDGKKWRCSKEAVPNHKYCERHMHRGRQQRSRKLVEQAATAEPARTSHFNMDLAPHSNTNLSISLPASVSPSTFVFSAAKKNESSLCF